MVLSEVGDNSLKGSGSSGPTLSKPPPIPVIKKLEESIGKMKLDESSSASSPSTSAQMPMPIPKIVVTDTDTATVPGEAESFEDMKLTPDLLRGVYGMGYEKPALCQKKTILPFINGRDVICQAQSGMGKTAAYCIGVLQRIDLKDKTVQALVVLPTRELAEQVGEVFGDLGKFMKGLRAITCIGGTRTRPNWEDLKAGVHVVIGTPGRISNLIKGKHLDPLQIKMLILDEADKMILDYSFRMELSYIIGQVNGDAQVMLASATMPSAALKHSEEFMTNAKLVLIPNEELTLQGIKQYYVMLDEEHQKLDTLVEIFPTMGQKKGVIFCNTRKRAEKVRKSLKLMLEKADERLVGGMVGTMMQEQRKDTMSKFRTGGVNMLVASDLIGRGIDVQQVQVVLNYELPDRKEEYIHRVGRAGRYGRTGIAITLVLNKPEDERKFKELQEFYRTVIEPLPARIGDIFNA